MSAPSIISDLVERFERNIEAYKNNKYNETQVRREFIDPFFKALGWDVGNEKGYAEAYKDVIHEFSLKTKDKAEAPDYLFRIGGIKKFFVEAKKPSVNLKEDISPAFQLRRYAWSAKLPLSILSDFEELVIYDCRIQPKKTDKSSTGRIKYFTYKDYVNSWDEIESIFSREAILKGSFDKYAETSKGKKGTAEVDDAFLKEIENWREILARNIALRNETLSNRELNFAVQKTIDRIIFLRICEDRGIEDYGQLMSLQNGVNVYKRLLQIFTRADEKYNSGLFLFEKEKNRTEEPDKITPEISIDDKVLKEIIKNLYYPDSPYEFSVLPSDILGHVYEQFLGKVIRLTAGHRAVVEAKPEVKKAGGVYYTPTYIVDYIVKNTLGKKLEEIEQKFDLTNSYSEKSEEIIKSISNKIKKGVNEVSALKILDPACGSGSFLIGAYQFLLDWHLRIYTSTDLSYTKSLKKDTPLYQTKENEYRLTTTEKKRILLNNIFGVDIDNQAVEVTKLSLLLKVLEGETDESLNTQISFFRQRALPDLSNNIKCGNSLIGPDFYNQTELALDDEERYRINVFDWQSEFKEIMSNGGFDVVIGNPPYRMVQPHNTNKVELEYYQTHYKAVSFKIDLYHLFIEKAIDLAKLASFCSYIIPSPILNNVYAKDLRKFISSKSNIKILALPNEKVFQKVDVFTIVFVLQTQETPTQNNRIKMSYNLEDYKNSELIIYNHISQEKLNSLNGQVWNLLLNESNIKLIEKIEENKLKLSEIAKINRGLITGDKTKYFSTIEVDDSYKPILSGSDVKRYFSNEPREFVRFVRPNSAGGSWDKEMHLANHKLLIRQIGKSPCATLIQKPYAITGNIFSIMNAELNYEYLILAFLNSNLIAYYWKIMFTDFKSTFPQVTIFSLGQLPIIKYSKNDENIDKLIQHVKKMIQYNLDFSQSKTPQEKTALQRQIDATDKQIDQLVYELYGLTEEEIKIVEKSVK